MENIRDIQLNNSFENTKVSSNVRKRSRARVKSKTRNYGKLKNIVIAINLFFIVFFTISLTVGYTDMVNISSDNLITKSYITELEVEVNSLNDLVAPFNSTNRIERIAKSRLDMIYPTVDNISEIKNIDNDRIIDIADLSTKNEIKEKESNSILSVITNIFR